ncbi:hypothetical protein ACGFY7_39210 [Streptomyces prunicolor]|uniref:hypothetical protein n=1 Tax=Streptomyces prunicolor TaxID=67348 RepID=UPI003720A117
MPDPSTPDEDGENASSAETAKPLSKKKILLGIGAVAVVAVGGLLIKLAQKNYATEDDETDESLGVRVQTPVELEFAAIARCRRKRGEDHESLHERLQRGSKDPIQLRQGNVDGALRV